MACANKLSEADWIRRYSAAHQELTGEALAAIPGSSCELQPKALGRGMRR
jgi:hypothetical protein